MARKKRRRLKKSVKRGCLLIAMLPLLFWGGTKAFRFMKTLLEQKHEEPKVEVAVDQTEMRERIDSIFRQTLRLDTSTISLEVCDVETGAVIYERNAHRWVAPASCMKLLTAVAAMHYLGIDYSYVSQLTCQGSQRGQTFRGRVCLQLADDPLLESLEPFVDALRRHGISRIEGDLQLQLMRVDTLRAHASAAAWDIPYHRLPITLKGQPRIEKDLNYLLASRGITVSRQPVSDEGASQLLYRHETPLTDVLAPMLIHSSNIKADALFGHLWRLPNLLPMTDFSEDWWVEPMLSQISEDHEGFVVNDGSGLSPLNRLSAHFLVELLQYAWQREPMRHVLIDEALATPGHPVRRGSLRGRMSAPIFRNHVFVKTGTLTSQALSSLAGYVLGADGRWRSFAIINENSPVAESHIFQDQLCMELVR